MLVTDQRRLCIICGKFFSEFELIETINIWEEIEYFCLRCYAHAIGGYGTNWYRQRIIFLGRTI